MKIFLTLLLIDAVSAQLKVGEHPFSKAFPLEPPKKTRNLYGQVEPVGPIDWTLRHPVCSAEESFFKADYHNTKPGNVAAMIQADEKQKKMEADQLKTKITLKKGPIELKEKTMKEIEKAQADLTHTETRLQDMASQYWQNPNLALDFSFSNSRRKLLMEQDLGQKKVMLLRNQLLNEEQRSAKEKDLRLEDLEDVKFDTWYVNMNKNVDRKECIERQLHESGIKANRFTAVEILGQTHEDRKALFQAKKAKDAEEAYLAQLTRLGYGDCIEGGFDFNATLTHGSQHSKEWHMRNAILANYCGHKRLLKEQANNASAAEYIVVMEDDVIIDRPWFKSVVQDFIANFDKNKKWSMVQLDPFGYKATEDFVGHFRGKPVWKPQFKAPCSQYWGFQAVIFKKSALPEINKWLATNPAMPIDWLQYKIDGALAFSSLTAHNPESLANANWQVGGKTVEAPKFCKKTVMQSTIA